MPLTLIIENEELWDPQKDEFITVKPQKIVLEHSLVSISKWEAKWHVSFIDDGFKSQEQLEHYIKCMTITQNVDPMVFKVICSSSALMNQITDYISDPMSATWFSENKQQTRKKEKMTSELIYYLMIAYNVPAEYQKWHLNRLLTLLRICGIKNEPPKKMGKNEIINSNRALNAARRKRLGTKG